MAQRPHVLLSRDGGRTYTGGLGKRKLEGRLLDRPPVQPAAIPVYDEQGQTRLLVLDLDAGRVNPGRVLADVTLLEQLAGQVGARVIVDRSPSGGHHVYLPLAEPLSLGEARSLVRALATRLPSLDITPMTNPITGVIRPPGSLYKGGKGHQELVTPLGIAHDILRRPAAPDVVQRLRHEFAAELLALAVDPATAGRTAGSGRAAAHGEASPAAEGCLSDDLADAPWQPRRGGPLPLTGLYRRIAETGLFPAERYRSPSDARQAVLCSAVAAGMRLVDVARRLETGLWPGLASFYARYRLNDRRRALVHDWHEADRYLLQTRKERRSQEPRNHTARGCDTRGQETQRARGRQGANELGIERTNAGASSRGPDRPSHDYTDYELVRMWIAAVDLEAPRRYTPGKHMLLRTLAEQAQRTGSIIIRVGCRSLSVGAGRRHHASVARQLEELRAELDPWIVLTDGYRGVLADEYELRIPDRWSDLAERRPWRRGKIHGLRPAFRALGPVAALVYEALENGAGNVSSRELARTLGRSPTAVQEALETLGAWNLARRVNGRWSHSPAADLNTVAEALGVLDDVADQLTRIREERRRWWEALGVLRLKHRDNELERVAAANAAAELYTRPDPDLPPPEPPPDYSASDPAGAADVLAELTGLRAAPPLDQEYTVLQLVEHLLGAELVESGSRLGT